MDQTTTVVPTSVIGPVLAAVVALIAYRMLIIRDRRPTTTAAHWYAAFIVLYAVLRVPEVQHWLDELFGLDLSDVRLLGAMLQVCSASALLLLGLRWRSRSGLTARWVWLAIATGCAAICVVLIAVNEPLRSTGLAVEQLSSSWRTGAYLTLHSFMFIPAELVIVVTLWQMAKSATC
ncbi:hypothetical protein [Gordonia rhizosphera]|uniref:hypothetical protein n=1 Tax=Gordonia rhizosphera TaxID=83341 RepID=UPI0012F62B29|nr:hypothetical protein [Gordonia rhizosphera]